ncbi:MAG TPA: hypothetical protein VK899_01245, partial [Gemmatimonadales bacterium]|nr:hypothetical protein [Gemmatimonadales bacterium]
VFTEVFGEPARGFLAPAWQQGHVRPDNVKALEGVSEVTGHLEKVRACSLGRKPTLLHTTSI